ncbi:FecR family protein [Reichenbachiella sp. MALMAid0571]|uniref:FecR family protein n=1 Tax=Reichenbachiella sp. MALMAid0571 TaxID=3143939 RepID=UPI0032DFD1F6
MNKNYSTYTVNDFLIDREFRDCVLRGNEGDKMIWDSIINKFPEKLIEVEEAKEIIMKMEFGGQFDLPESKKIQMWNLLSKELKHGEEFEEKHHKYLNYRPDREKFWYGHLIKIAASVLILLICGLVYNKSTQKSENAAPEYIVKSTELGEKLTIVLPDKSRVKLNSGSKLVYPSYFANDVRELYLEGEAFFEVTEDKSRPFQIKAGNIKTTVLGTSFVLKSVPDLNIAQVAVLTGKVGVQSLSENNEYEKEHTIVLPSEILNYDSKSATFSKGIYNPLEVLAWKDGIIFFKNDNLDSIIEKLVNWYGVEVEVINKEKIKVSYNGTFQNSSLEKVLDGIKLSSNFNYEIDQNKVTLTGI